MFLVPLSFLKGSLGACITTWRNIKNFRLLDSKLAWASKHRKGKKFESGLVEVELRVLQYIELFVRVSYASLFHGGHRTIIQEVLDQCGNGRIQFLSLLLVGSVHS